MKTSTPALTAGIVSITAVAVLVLVAGCSTTKPPPSVPAEEQASVEPEVESVPQAPDLSEAAAPAESEELQDYTVQKGDSLSKIAARYGLRTRELAELNNLADPNKLRVGDRILLPADARPRGDAARPAAEPAASMAEDGSQLYTIRPGDSLSEIAAAHGTTVPELRSANNLTGDRIIAGQQLKIPAPGMAEPSAPEMFEEPAVGLDEP